MKANLIVGAGRSNSSTRWFLCPRFGDLRPLPVLFIGFVVNLASAEISPILDIDPLMSRGLLSGRGTFMYYSVLSNPESNGNPHY
jgi:hypothetical protein